MGTGIFCFFYFVTLGKHRNTFCFTSPVVCGKEIEDLCLQEVLPAPIMKMAVIPNGGLVACWCSDGSVIVLKEDLKERMNMIMDTKSVNVPRQMVWVGEHANTLCEGVKTAGETNK